MFDAIVFCVRVLNFEPRCALEQDSGTVERLSKILELIEECAFGIHDLSYMKIDPHTHLPRYNMPFELGLFLGCEFAGRDRMRKSCLILDSDPWRYRKSLSDLSGRDIRAHMGKPAQAIAVVRDWLVTESGSANAPGGEFVIARYRRFRKELPALCKRVMRTVSELSFWDYRDMMARWLEDG